jgi:hypothetical protein
VSSPSALHTGRTPSQHNVAATSYKFGEAGWGRQAGWLAGWCGCRSRLGPAPVAASAAGAAGGVDAAAAGTAQPASRPAGSRG